MAVVKYDFAPPPPSLAPAHSRAVEPGWAGGRAHTHTQILISAAVQRVCDHSARSTVTFKKNKKYQNVPWDLEIYIALFKRVTLAIFL